MIVVNYFEVYAGTDWFGQAPVASQPMAATESSPLLNNFFNRDNILHLPSVDEGLALAQTRGIFSFNRSEQCPPTLSQSPSAQTAYGLLILSQWRVVVESNAPRTKDIWERIKLHASSTRDLRALDDAINSLWVDFTTEYRTNQDIRRVLWTPFPVKQGSCISLRGTPLFCGIVDWSVFDV